MMRRGAGCCAALIAAGLASGAGATGTISCTALDGSAVSVEMNMASSPVEKPLWLRITDGEELWSSLPEDGGTPIAIARAFADERQLAVDAADDEALGLVASLRVLRTEEDGERYQIGYLQRHGRGVTAVACEGP